MVRMKPTVSVVLIGDVVGSRRAQDRRALHQRLTEELAAANAVHAPREELRLTVGDEFQGVFARLGDTLAAAASLRVALLPEVDVRFGVGRGEVEVLDEVTRIQDGPGWWAARDAIEQAAQREDRAATRLARTVYVPAPDDDRAPAVNAALLCRDHMVGSLDERSIRILRGLMAGRTQTDIAPEEGISPAAVSQRVRRHGLEVILAAQDDLAVLS
jgi:hypothetical protein